MLYQRRVARTQTKLAEARYHRHYNNALYQAAVEGRSNAFANALTDEALAICGHPGYRLSYRRYAENAKEFLHQFGQD